MSVIVRVFYDKKIKFVIFCKFNIRQKSNYTQKKYFYYFSNIFFTHMYNILQFWICDEYSISFAYTSD